MRAAWRRLVLVVVAAATLGAATVDDLFTAASIDNLRTFRRLLDEKTIDPKSLDPRGETLLIAAIRNDATRVAEYLIAEQGTDLEATNAAGETALMIAAYRKRKDLVERLIARDAEVNRTGWTALHYAASVDAADVVALLLEHAAYIDAESPNQTTPLMMAARGGFDRVCRILVEAGADPTPINQRDLAAADFARRGGQIELATWLDAQSAAWRAKYPSSSSTRTAPTR